MSKAIIIYGSSTGATEDIAKRIASKMGGAEVMNVTQFNESSAASLGDYDLIILGSSTWGIGDLQDDWHEKLDTLKGADLSGKKVAIFGTGDQFGYGDSFVDAIGILAEAAEAAGATIVGHTSTEGYEFEESQAVRDGSFLGLAVDDTNQEEQTDPRIAAWVASLS
ncbi:MAG: flavodoxin [Spirochaetaceae bacterium]